MDGRHLDFPTGRCAYLPSVTCFRQSIKPPPPPHPLLLLLRLRLRLLLLYTHMFRFPSGLFYSFQFHIRSLLTRDTLFSVFLPLIGLATGLASSYVVTGLFCHVRRSLLPYPSLLASPSGVSYLYGTSYPKKQ